MTAHERAREEVAWLRYMLVYFGIPALSLCTGAELLARQQSEWLP
jgi:hypothetical protein